MPCFETFSKFLLHIFIRFCTKLYAQSYITDGEDERISAMLNVPGLLPRLCQIVKFASQNESNYKILVPALRTLGNVVSGILSCEAIFLATSCWW